MSANHNGSLTNRFSHYRRSQKGGADAVKIQSYTADTITLPCESEDFMIRGGLWDGQSLYQLYQKSPYALGVAPAAV